MKLAKCSAKLVANFRRSLEGDFRAFFAGEIVRSIFHENSTANFTINFTTRFWVVAGPNLLRIANHYSIYSKSAHDVAIHHICSSDSLRVVNSLQIAIHYAYCFWYVGVPWVVALCHAIRLQFGYGFESCVANGPKDPPVLKIVRRANSLRREKSLRR